MRPKQRVIIVGAGDLGKSMAEKLSHLNNEVTLIDQDEQKLSSVSTNFGGNVVLGDAASSEVLKEINLGECDLFISATECDKTNLYLALLAKKYYRIPKIYIRLYDKNKSKVLEGESITIVCPAELSVKQLEETLLREV